MQRNPLHHCTFYSGPTGCALRLALSLEEAVLFGVRILHDDSEKRDSYCHPYALGDVRRSRLSHRKTSSPRRNCFLPAGLTLVAACSLTAAARRIIGRSEEHTSELQSRLHLVCRLLL